jgi:hypothetical protein
MCIKEEIKTSHNYALVALLKLLKIYISFQINFENKKKLEKIYYYKQIHKK